MHRPPKLLIFSDLDGTLLDHRDYTFDAARPALRALADFGGGVVLASSKTAAEMAPLRARMELSAWPAIVENGAGVLPAGADVVAGGGDYAALRQVLAGLPKGFRGFGDMTDADVAQATGLGLEAAALARKRAFSEPGLWLGAEDGLEPFLSEARAKGLTARQGGRFLTLSFGATKADRMQDLVRVLQPAQTMALGDAPNDIEMLEAADYGVIIRNDHGPDIPALRGEATGRITRSALPGPKGWNAAVLAHLAQFDLTDKETPTDG